jgi:hypothetical protein
MFNSQGSRDPSIILHFQAKGWRFSFHIDKAVYSERLLETRKNMVASNGRVTEIDELERMWKEAIAAHFDISQDMPGETEEKHENIKIPCFLADILNR